MAIFSYNMIVQDGLDIDMVVEVENSDSDLVGEIVAGGPASPSATAISVNSYASRSGNEAGVSLVSGEEPVGGDYPAMGVWVKPVGAAGNGQFIPFYRADDEFPLTGFTTGSNRSVQARTQDEFLQFSPWVVQTEKADTSVGDATIEFTITANPSPRQYEGFEWAVKVRGAGVSEEFMFEDYDLEVDFGEGEPFINGAPRSTTLFGAQSRYAYNQWKGAQVYLTPGTKTITITVKESDGTLVATTDYILVVRALTTFNECILIAHNSDWVTNVPTIGGTPVTSIWTIPAENKVTTMAQAGVRLKAYYSAVTPKEVLVYMMTDHPTGYAPAGDIGGNCAGFMVLPWDAGGGDEVLCNLLLTPASTQGGNFFRATANITGAVTFVGVTFNSIINRDTAYDVRAGQPVKLSKTPETGGASMFTMTQVIHDHDGGMWDDTPVPSVFWDNDDYEWAVFGLIFGELGNGVHICGGKMHSSYVNAWYDAEGALRSARTKLFTIRGLDIYSIGGQQAGSQPAIRNTTDGRRMKQEFYFSEMIVEGGNPPMTLKPSSAPTDRTAVIGVVDRCVWLANWSTSSFINLEHSGVKFRANLFVSSDHVPNSSPSNGSKIPYAIELFLGGSADFAPEWVNKDHHYFFRSCAYINMHTGTYIPPTLTFTSTINYSLALPAPLSSVGDDVVFVFENCYVWHTSLLNTAGPLSTLDPIEQYTPGWRKFWTDILNTTYANPATVAIPAIPQAGSGAATGSGGTALWRDLLNQTGGGDHDGPIMPEA